MDSNKSKELTTILKPKFSDMKISDTKFSDLTETIDLSSALFTETVVDKKKNTNTNSLSCTQTDTNYLNKKLLDIHEDMNFSSNFDILNNYSIESADVSAIETEIKKSDIKKSDIKKSDKDKIRMVNTIYSETSVSEN